MNQTESAYGKELQQPPVNPTVSQSDPVNTGDGEAIDAGEISILDERVGSIDTSQFTSGSMRNRMVVNSVFDTTSPFKTPVPASGLAQSCIQVLGKDRPSISLMAKGLVMVNPLAVPISFDGDS